MYLPIATPSPKSSCLTVVPRTTTFLINLTSFSSKKSPIATGKLFTSVKSGTVPVTEVVAFLFAYFTCAMFLTWGATCPIRDISFLMACASPIVRVSTEPVLTWPIRAAPGLTLRRFVPNLWIDSVTCLLAPSPIDIIAIIAPAPIIIPSMVRKDLILFAIIPLKATCITFHSSISNSPRQCLYVSFHHGYK